MSSPSRPLRSTFRGALLSGLLVAVAAMSACTVRPLYSSDPLSPTGKSAVAADLSTISIKPVDTRYGQELRNHLIFLFNGGAGQPAAAKYTLTLSVRSQIQSAAEIQTARQNEPTAGTATLTATYVLADAATAKPVAVGKRQITSSFDSPRQEFAVLRAQRDAENRAARELANLLQLAIAENLSRLPQ